MPVKKSRINVEAVRASIGREIVSLEADAGARVVDEAEDDEGDPLGLMVGFCKTGRFAGTIPPPSI